MSQALHSFVHLIKINKSLLVGLLVLVYGVSWGQTTRTFIVTNGAWTNASNWSPSGVPGSQDNVIIPSNVTNVSNIPGLTVNSIEIQGTSGTLTFSAGGNNSENFLVISSSLSLLAGRTLQINPGTGQRRLSLEFGVNCSSNVFGIINLSGRNNPGEQGVINRGALSLGPNGLIQNTSNSAYFTTEAGSTIRIGSAEGISATPALTGNIRTTTRSFNIGANYQYSGVSNQIFGNGLPGTVNSLTISNTGPVGNNTVTPVGNTLIATDLSVISGILDLGTFTVNRASAGGTFSMGANAGMLVGGEDGTNFPTNYSLTMLNCTSTVNYNFSGNQTVRAFNYGTLILSGSGIKTLQTSTTAICSNFTLSGTAITTAVVGLTIGGNLTIGTGTSFSAGAFSHQVGGNWTNQGTFNAGTSTFNFAGPSPGTITNSGTGDFFTISFGGLGTKTIASNLSPTGNIQQVATALVFSGSSTLTLSTGRSMEVNASGSVSTGSGRIILQPGSLYINRSSSNPTLEVRQNLTGNRGWRMIGSPVSSTYSAFTSGFENQGFPGSTNPTLQPNLLWWDETDKGTSLQAWRQPANLSDTVPAGRGHYFYVFNGDTKPGGGNYSDALPKNLSVTGTEVNLASSFFDFGVTYTPRDSNLVAQADTLIEVNQANEGFNLIANPTASVIDFYASSGWNKTNIDQTIYVWDPSVGEFLTWNGSTGTLGHGRIQPFQAFWVKANAPSPILRLTGNGAKSFISAGFYGRKMEDSNPVLELNVVGEGLRAQSLISFGQDGKEGADPKDAYQLESLAENWLLLYSFGSTKTKSPLVINHQPQLAEGQSRIIPLHLAASKKGEPFKGTYLMDWKLPLDWNPETEIVLMDHINQKAIDMRKENLYSFNFEAPKLPLSNSRKNSNGMSIPQAVVFQTPYEIGQEEEVSPNLIHSRSTSSTKPRRPFSIYIGSFPNGQVEYLPELPKLFAPSPNPFSKETKIRFYLPSAESAELVIYNLFGQEVGNFPARVYEAGIQELDWIPSAIALPSGMYVIRLNTSSGQFTQKLIKN